MSDRRRIVTISPAGTVTTLEDFDDNATLYSVRDSFVVKPGERSQAIALSGRRYGGGQTASETHGNGAISWTALVRGTTNDNVLTNVETALQVLEQPRNDLYFEWRPDGATNSVFYRVAGPATWASKYSWVEFLGAKCTTVEISIPVRPLPERAASTISITSRAWPATVQLGTAIGGKAPARADVTINMAAAQPAAPIWAMIAWTKRPAASTVGGAVAPFGIIQAETASGPTTWAAGSNARYSGGQALETTTSAAGTADAEWLVDPAVMQPDDFSTEITVEVWARYTIASTVVNPRLALAAYPSATAQSIVYSPEWGSDGRPLVKGSSGTVDRVTRLGTITLPVDTANPSGWNVGVIGRWDAGSTGLFALDYIACVPARQRAVSPSGKSASSGFPLFFPDTGANTKTIASDLSGVIDTPPARDSGLGGSPIELPPGTVDVFFMPQSRVPDDPTASTGSAVLSHTASASVKVTPRYFLASD